MSRLLMCRDGERRVAVAILNYATSPILAALDTDTFVDVSVRVLDAVLEYEHFGSIYSDNAPPAREIARFYPGVDKRRFVAWSARDRELLRTVAPALRQEFAFTYRLCESSHANMVRFQHLHMPDTALDALVACTGSPENRASLERAINATAFQYSVTVRRTHCVHADDTTHNCALDMRVERVIIPVVGEPITPE